MPESADQLVQSEFGRGRRLMRLLPAALLSAFYALISLSWFARGIEEVGSATSSRIWANHALLSLNAVTTALFFAILSCLMFTRLEPIRRHKGLAGWALPTIIVVLFGFMGTYDPVTTSTPWIVASTIITVSGTLFTLYSLRHLGRHFGVVPDVRGMVTSGPYRFVRHPLYGGETLSFLGILILIATPLTVGIFMIGLALQIWRARIEEHALSSVFPEYRAYAARTPMLFPLPRLTLRRAAEVKAVGRR